MNKYHCYFNGREVGAIGIMSNQMVVVHADNKADAELKLYDTHDHITGLRIIPASYAARDAN